MEGVEDIVIAGAEIAGLTTALGLHRYNNFIPKQPSITTFYFITM